MSLRFFSLICMIFIGRFAKVWKELQVEVD